MRFLRRKLGLKHLDLTLVRWTGCPVLRRRMPSNAIGPPDRWRKRARWTGQYCNRCDSKSGNQAASEPSATTKAGILIPPNQSYCDHRPMRSGQVKVLALIVLLTAGVPAFAQTDSDTNGTGTSHGFAVSDGDTVKFGKQRIRLFGIDPKKDNPAMTATDIPVRWRQRLSSPSSPAAQSGVTRSIMTTRITVRSRSALPATTTFRR